MSRSCRPLTSSPKCLHATEWDERFIFDNEVKPELPTDAVKIATRLRHLVAAQPTFNSHFCDARSQSTTHHFAERCDGELVTVFSRREIAPSQVNNGDANGVFADTATICVSPFDMKKVRDALEADESDSEEACRAAGSNHVYQQADLSSKSIVRSKLILRQSLVSCKTSAKMISSS